MCFIQINNFDWFEHLNQISGLGALTSGDQLPNYNTGYYPAVLLAAVIIISWFCFQSNLGEEATFRIQTLLLAPIGVVSLWSMFVFLGGRTVGYNLYKKLFRNGKQTR